MKLTPEQAALAREIASRSRAGEMPPEYVVDAALRWFDLVTRPDSDPEAARFLFESDYRRALFIAGANGIRQTLAALGIDAELQAAPDGSIAIVEPDAGGARVTH